jgi:hypothetical protein
LGQDGRGDAQQQRCRKQDAMQIHSAYLTAVRPGR